MAIEGCTDGLAMLCIRLTQEQRAELAELLEKYGSLPGWSKELAKHANAGKDMQQYRTKQS